MGSPGQQLKALTQRQAPLFVPLVLDPLMAAMAQAAGFEALYLGGGTLGYVKTVTEANLSLTQMAQETVDIRAACPLPLILDAQCGWGDAMHVRNTVRMAEAAGVAALEIEDQLAPKRAHHHIGIEHLIPLDHMVEKIRVAVSARRDPDTVIIARTNACRSEGLDEALRRAEAFRKAGADMLLLLQKTPEEIIAIGERIEGPLVLMITAGPTSMPASLDDLGKLGYRIVLDALTPFYARQRALRLSYEALAGLRADPTVGDAFAAETKYIHDLIGLDDMLAIEKRTVER